MASKFFIFAIVLLIFSAMAMVDRPTGNAAAPTVSCNVDTDCVPASCCHATACVHANEAPDCTDVACTLECKPGTLDCGTMRCGCFAGKCVTKLF